MKNKAIVFYSLLLFFVGLSNSYASAINQDEDVSFVRWAKSLPALSLTKDSLAEAFVGSIVINSRTWRLDRINDYNNFRDLILSPQTTITEIGYGNPEQMHAGIFEIDSESKLRKVINLINETVTDDDGFCFCLPITFITELTEEERRHPLVSKYQYPCTFERYDLGFKTKNLNHKMEFIKSMERRLLITTKLAIGQNKNDAEQAADSYLKELYADFEELQIVAKENGDEKKDN